MKLLEKILLTSSLICGLTINSATNVHAQEKSVPPEKGHFKKFCDGDFMLPQRMYGPINLEGVETRAPPVIYWSEGDTLYIGGNYASKTSHDLANNSQYIFKIVLPPKERKLAEHLIEYEIKDNDKETMYFKLKRFDGHFFETEAIQIGYFMPFYFEEKKINKKQK